MTERIRVVVNGDDRDVAPGTTVAALLDELGVDRRYVAVERNRAIVPRAEHGDTVLTDDDSVEVVTMVGGG